jgi:hypothetical protein
MFENCVPVNPSDAGPMVFIFYGMFEEQLFSVAWGFSVLSEDKNVVKL